MTPDSIARLRAALARQGLDEVAIGAALAELQDEPGDRTFYDPVDGAEPSPFPDRLGRFEDLGALGQGGMGEVRRVRDPVLGRTMALKRLQPRFRDSPDAVARFVEEAQVTAQLQHPGVIPVHELWQLPDGAHYFTMQEVRGRTLSEVIAQVHARTGEGRWGAAPDGWSLWRLLDALRRVAETVAFAHARGVIHRDLKPGNVMVGAYGEVLVLDWGLARVRAGEAEAEDVQTSRAGVHTVAGRISGTPGYMAPEQAAGRPEEIGPHTDVYALGATLCFILTGGTPRRPELPATGVGGAPIPEDLRRLCRAALAPEIARRLPDAAALSAELAAWLEGARRRELALERVREADQAKAEAERLGQEARARRARAEALLSRTQPWTPVEEKAPAWEDQDEAARLELGATLAELQHTELLASALTELPDLPEAHARLADHYQELHRAAEARRDPLSSARYEALLRAHDRGRYAGWLSGRGSLSLDTAPSGAEVLLYRYEERRRRLVPVFVRSLGPTPLVDLPLDRGSWLLVLRAEGREEVRLPVCLGREERLDLTRPGEDAPRPVPLPPRGALRPDEIYVPAGWYASGDVEPTAGALPPRRIWLDGFVIRRFPVTLGELLAEANRLRAEGHPEAAERILPWSKARGAVAPPLVDGQYRLPTDEDGDTWDADWPAFQLCWDRARAAAAALAAREGLPWRLPSELEWEKAARGADGRLFPWGDFVDPTWANLRQSQPGDRPLPRPVSAFPTDESPYGVRGLAGGVVEWCLEPFEPQGPPLVDGRLDLAQVLATLDLDLPARAVRGGAYSYFEGGARIGRRTGMAAGLVQPITGLRLARSYPEDAPQA